MITVIVAQPDGSSRTVAVTPSGQGIWSILRIFKACGQKATGQDRRPYGDPRAYRW